MPILKFWSCIQLVHKIQCFLFKNNILNILILLHLNYSHCILPQWESRSCQTGSCCSSTHIKSWKFAFVMDNIFFFSIFTNEEVPQLLWSSCSYVKKFTHQMEFWSAYLIPSAKSSLQHLYPSLTGITNDLFSLENSYQHMNMLQEFPNKMANKHPLLLPSPKHTH